MRKKSKGKANDSVCQWVYTGHRLWVRRNMVIYRNSERRILQTARSTPTEITFSQNGQRADEPTTPMQMQGVFLYHERAVSELPGRSASKHIGDLETRDSEAEPSSVWRRQDG